MPPPGSGVSVGTSAHGVMSAMIRIYANDRQGPCGAPPRPRGDKAERVCHIPDGMRRSWLSRRSSTSAIPWQGCGKATFAGFVADLRVETTGYPASIISTKVSARCFQISLPRGGRCMADGPFDPETGELIPRPPVEEDVVGLCRKLNSLGARFVCRPRHRAAGSHVIRIRDRSATQMAQQPHSPIREGMAPLQLS